MIYMCSLKTGSQSPSAYSLMTPPLPLGTETLLSLKDHNVFKTLPNRGHSLLLTLREEDNFSPPKAAKILIPCYILAANPFSFCNLCPPLMLFSFPSCLLMSLVNAFLVFGCYPQGLRHCCFPISTYHNPLDL